MTSARNLAGIYLRGFCMGIADAIPGVSGGTIALITGIYERLISAITEITVDRMFQLFRDVGNRNRTSVSRSLQQMDF